MPSGWKWHYTSCGSAIRLCQETAPRGATPSSPGCTDLSWGVQFLISFSFPSGREIKQRQLWCWEAEESMCSEANVCILAVYREPWQTTVVALAMFWGFCFFVMSLMPWITTDQRFVVLEGNCVDINICCVFLLKKKKKEKKTHPNICINALHSLTLAVILITDLEIFRLV